MPESSKCVKYGQLLEPECLYNYSWDEYALRVTREKSLEEISKEMNWSGIYSNLL